MSDLPQDPASDSPRDVNPPADFPLLPDLLKNIPEEQRDQLLQFVSQIEIYGHFSGPLPPPNVLNLYDADTRKIIVAESVEFRRHRNKSESRTLIFFFVRDILSLIAAFTLALVLIVGSIILIQQGQSIAGLLGIGGTVAVIAGAFLIRDRRQRNERAVE
ncbi:MAG: hypothetical protein OXG68_04370 [Chloroflexi bacterium]|nr:hypothetical protein [Chloroflexota bacterium]